MPIALGRHGVSRHRTGAPSLPEFNGRVDTPRGPRFVDLLWRRLRLGVEIDGEAYHRGVAQWRSDLVRQNDLVAQGLVLLRFPGARVVYDIDAVVGEIGRVLRDRAREWGGQDARDAA